MRIQNLPGIQSPPETALYNGFLYHVLVDPLLRKVRRLIAEKIKPGASVIDIGCGTGQLLLELSSLCRKVEGVEISEEMVQFARKRLRKTPNAAIFPGNAALLKRYSKKSFDFATCSMVFHEMEEEERLPALNEMARVAEVLILVDYAAPIPRLPAKLAINAVERFAGKSNFRKFRSFQLSGGLPSLVSAARLTCVESRNFFFDSLLLLKVESNPPP